MEIQNVCNHDVVNLYINLTTLMKSHTSSFVAFVHIYIIPTF